MCFLVWVTHSALRSIIVDFVFGCFAVLSTYSPLTVTGGRAPPLALFSRKECYGMHRVMTQGSWRRSCQDAQALRDAPNQQLHTREKMNKPKLPDRNRFDKRTYLNHESMITSSQHTMQEYQPKIVAPDTLTTPTARTAVDEGSNHPPRLLEQCRPPNDAF